MSIEKPANNNLVRFDLQIISDWIKPGASVLDLGCGSGELLKFLKENKKIRGTGIESSEAKVAECIAKGLSVMQGDINVEIEDYPDDAYDFVILSQTLQQVFRPVILINELLRVGRKVVVSFPNFSHWNIRLQVLLSGKAPKSRQLPFDWYNSPNIRVITLDDFRDSARNFGFTILEEVAINTHQEDRSGKIIKFFRNLRATYGIFLIQKDS